MSDPKLVPKPSDDATAPDLQLDLLNELDRSVNLVNWTIPIKSDGALPVLLVQAIQLVKQGLLVSLQHVHFPGHVDRPSLNRFINQTLFVALDKLLNSTEARAWKVGVQVWI